MSMNNAIREDPHQVLHLHPRLGESSESRSDRDQERNAIRARRTIRCARRIDHARFRKAARSLSDAGHDPQLYRFSRQRGSRRWASSLSWSSSTRPGATSAATIWSPRGALRASRSTTRARYSCFWTTCWSTWTRWGRHSEKRFGVLAPGGIAFVKTTNKLEFTNREYRRPLFQWLPGVLKESVIHHHLHFDPRLANFTERPAVHWFTYASLCALGREAGFARFYTVTDLLRPEDPEIRGGWLRRAALPPPSRARRW